MVALADMELAIKRERIDGLVVMTSEFFLSDLFVVTARSSRSSR